MSAFGSQATPHASGPSLTLEGVLERVTFFNEENNYTVARLQVEGRLELVTIVGNLPAANPGETLRLRGRWSTHARFGEQFQVESCTLVLPATLTGMEKYLGSGLVKGIGPVMAGRIVRLFELATFEVIETTPERLREVGGIGPVRADRIARAWEEQRQVREVMVFLQGHGVSSTYAVKIYKQYGDQAIAVVRANPYRLAEDIWGIGFKTADRIARNLGFAEDSPERAQAGLLYLLGQTVDEGHVYYPETELLERCEKELAIPATILGDALETIRREDRVVIEDGAPNSDRDTKSQRRVYLKALHVAEVGAARRLRELVATPPAELELDVEKALVWVQRTTGLKLAEAQVEALRAALDNQVTIITGGPGTGKTTLVQCLIRIWEAKGLAVVLASPTGRAAKRLSEASGHEARTLHRLLEYSPGEGGFKRNADNPLAATAVVVDEFSMVDVLLFYHLLRALPPSCRLVLVGDADQLPSVGPGNVLRDLINSGAVATVSLSHIFRQAEQSRIVTNAHRVNRGEFPDLSRAGSEGQSDFYFIERAEPEAALETILELCGQRIPRAYMLDPYSDIQVIGPMHRGVVGVMNLNARLQALLNPTGREVSGAGRVFHVGDKVMQVKNDYEKEVFNGDIGRIARLDEESGAVAVNFDGRFVDYERNELDQLTLAYAISVHKAQGSEHTAVVLPLLTQHYIMLQRNLLYTAITRARRLLVIVGSKRALAIAVRNNQVQKRYTALCERLGG